MSIRQYWKSIEDGLSRFEGETFQLNEPASKSAIDEFEAEFEIELPSSLVESLLIHDGETVHGNSIFTWAFCSIKSIGDTIRMQRQILGLEQRKTPYVDSAPSGFVRSDIDWSSKWLPVMSSEAGEVICDFDPGSQGNSGQIFCAPPYPNGLPREVIAESYDSLLCKLAEIVNTDSTEMIYGQITISTMDFGFTGS